MYPISNDVLALFEAEQPKVLRITGTDKNGTAITITDNDVVADSFQLDRYTCNGEKLEVGTAVAAQMTLKLFNGNGQFDDIVFEGTELNVEIGIADWSQASPVVTYVPCGLFTPDVQPRRMATISLTCLDRMTKFDVAVDATALTFPATVAGLVGQACTVCGVTLAQSIASLPNANVSISALPSVNGIITYRNIIQWCAGIMATNAWMDWNGQLRFSWYNNSTSYVSTMDNRYSSDLYENDLTVTGVVYTNDSGIEIVEGTDEYAIDLTGNALAGPLIATVLPAINTAVNGFAYRPFTAAVINAPYLWPMDSVVFTDKDGNNHASVLTNVAFGVNGTTALESKGMTEAINKLQAPVGVTKEQAQLISQAMEQVETDIDDSLTQQEIFNRLTDNGAAQGLVLYNGQLYVNASYINAGYLSADRIAANAIAVGKLSGTISGGLNDSWVLDLTNGTFTIGNISASKITTDVMSADRIRGGTLVLGGLNNQNGTLQVLDASGNVVGTWDNNGVEINGGTIHIPYGDGHVWLGGDGLFYLHYLYEGLLYKLSILQDELRYSVGSVDQSRNDNIISISPKSIRLFRVSPDAEAPDIMLYDSNGDTQYTYIGVRTVEAQTLSARGALVVGDAATTRANLGITPANIGALPLAGGTMTGPINMGQSGSSSSGQTIYWTTADGTKFEIRPYNNIFQIVRTPSGGSASNVLGIYSNGSILLESSNWKNALGLGSAALNFRVMDADLSPATQILSLRGIVQASNNPLKGEDVSFVVRSNGLTLFRWTSATAGVAVWNLLVDSTTNALEIGSGGTGATTAAAARDNLSASTTITFTTSDTTAALIYNKLNVLRNNETATVYIPGAVMALLTKVNGTSKMSGAAYGTVARYNGSPNFRFFVTRTDGQYAYGFGCNVTASALTTTAVYQFAGTAM